MIKKLLTLAAFVMCVGSSFAQVTGVAPESGKTYYIYNVDAGMYMNHGSSWGTHVTVDGAGCAITIGGEGGEYTLHHDGIAANKYQTEDGWSDNTTAGKFAFEETSKGSGVYYIKCSSGKYYKYAGGVGQWGDEAGVDDKSETNAFQWIFVPQADREAIKAGNDVTYLLKNPDFEGMVEQAKTPKLQNWSGDFATQTSEQANITGIFAEKWAGSYSTTTGTLNGNNYHLNDYSIYQSITIPAGKYTLSAQAWAVQQIDEEEITGAYLFAGDITTLLGANNNYSVEFKTDGTELNIGVKTESTTANWVVCDKFRLVCVEPALSVCAIYKTSPFDGEGGNWYYINIPADGKYKLTTTNGDIIYTQDGSACPSEIKNYAANGTILDLTAGALYIELPANNTVTVAATSHVYALGDVTLSTADGKYTQNATYTVTFPSEGATDPEATAALVSGSKATVNGSEVALTATEHGFTFSLGTITAGTVYNITIPANVYGYSGHAMNEAINVTVNAPAVLDGTYYVKTGDLYLSRGNIYNTCAVVNPYGTGVYLTTDVEGISKFQFVDNKKYLFDANSGTIFTDNTTYPNWKIVAVTGGYNIVNQNATSVSTKDNALWIEANTDANYKYDRLVTKAEGTAAVFTFQSPADHATRMATLKANQAKGVAEAFGLASIDTSILPATDVTITGADGESFQKGSDITETLTSIPNGLYKVSVNAFSRIGGHANTWEARQAGCDYPDVVLYANDQEVQIKSMFDQDVKSAEKRHTNDVLYDGNYYPDRVDGAKAAIEAGNYLNEIFVNVTDGTLKFGLFKGNAGKVGDWMYYNNFKVTYYGKVERETASEKYGTICLPYAFTATGAKIYSAALNGTTVELTEVANPVAGTPYIYQATADAQTFTYASGNIVAAPVAAAPLTGVLTATEVPVGSYVLQTQSAGQKFYIVKADNQPTLSANKAYLTVPASSGAKVLNIGSEETAIKALDALTSGDAKIYDINGRELKSLQKGMNIVNGVKVLVK